MLCYKKCFGRICRVYACLNSKVCVPTQLHSSAHVSDSTLSRSAVSLLDTPSCSAFSVLQAPACTEECAARTGHYGGEENKAEVSHLDFTIQTGVSTDVGCSCIRVTGSMRLRRMYASIADLSYTWPAALITGSLNSSCVTGHTRSGGLSSNDSKAVFAADASDKVGGESGRRVPEGEEHKPLLRVADILIVVFGLPIGDRSHCQRL